MGSGERRPQKSFDRALERANELNKNPVTIQLVWHENACPGFIRLYRCAALERIV